MNNPHNLLANETFASVWDAIESTPEQSSKSKLKSELIICIREWLDKSGARPTDALEKLGVTESVVGALYSGNISAFSLDALIDLALSLGLSIQINAKS